MALFSLGRTSAIGVAISLLAGCGGSSQGQSAVPASLSSATVRSSERHSASQIHKSKSPDDLLYVTDINNKTVTFYSYPKGKKEGQLTGLSTPGALCADRSGNVFVTNVVAPRVSNVLEFAHGGTTPIQTLNNPAVQTSACAVNPVTGDLAVANFCTYGKQDCNRRGNVALYTAGKGSPRYLSILKLLYITGCTYDAAGTLYVLGYAGRRQETRIYSLANDQSKFQEIEIHYAISQPPILVPEGMQWDGQYLAVYNPQFEYIPASLYRISPTTGQVASILKFQKTANSFFIDGSRLIVSSSSVRGGKLLFYKYPEGTKVNRVIGGLTRPDAVVVSSGSGS